MDVEVVLGRDAGEVEKVRMQALLRTVSSTRRASRQLFETSPGQVPSLRALPQTTSTRDGDALSCHAVCAAESLSRVARHSSDSS
jgi:hypothetical protein